MVVTEKEIWREILIAYKDLPCLWKPTDDNYYSRDIRQKAVDSLLSIYRKLEPTATCLNFKKRLENMRTSYNREKKKVRHSFFTEPNPEKRHAPTLWYYDLMRFLDDGEDKPGTKKWEPLDLEIQPEESDISKKRKTREKSQIINGNPFLAPENNIHQKEERSWEIQGKAIGYSLRELREDQKIIAEKLISDVIFYGKLGKLTNSAFVTVSSEPDDELRFSEKYINLGASEYGVTSPASPNHSSTNAPHFVSSDTASISKAFKPKILIVKRIKEE